MAKRFDRNSPLIGAATGCASIEEAACTRALAKDGDLPFRGGFIDQSMNLGDHSIPGSYIPFSWATLRRWQQTQETGGTVVTKREYDLVAAALETMRTKVQDQGKQTRNTQRYNNNDPEYLQTVTDLNKESQNLLDS